MGLTCGALIKLEGLVMRNVIRDRSSGYVLVGCSAERSAVRVSRTWLKASLKPPPSDASRVQEIADVLARHCDLGAALRSAIVEGSGGSGIPDERTACTDQAGCRARDHRGAMRLAGDKVQSSRRRGAEGRGEAVVAHCEVLRVIPERRDGVAVVVAHYDRLAITTDVARGN